MTILSNRILALLKDVGRPMLSKEIAISLNQTRTIGLEPAVSARSVVMALGSLYAKGLVANDCSDKGKPSLWSAKE